MRDLKSISFHLLPAMKNKIKICRQLPTEKKKNLPEQAAKVVSLVRGSLMIVNNTLLTDDTYSSSLSSSLVTSSSILLIKFLLSTIEDVIDCLWRVEASDREDDWGGLWLVSCWTMLWCDWLILGLRDASSEGASFLWSSDKHDELVELRRRAKSNVDLIFLCLRGEA